LLVFDNSFLKLSRISYNIVSPYFSCYIIHLFRNNSLKPPISAFAKTVRLTLILALCSNTPPKPSLNLCAFSLSHFLKLLTYSCASIASCSLFLGANFCKISKTSSLLLPLSFSLVFYYFHISIIPFNKREGLTPSLVLFSN
jgi:hypothetical protein